MGEVVAAGILAHVPTIMLPVETRKELNEGEDFSLVQALHDLRQDVFETLDYDTVVVLDSHWFTTVEFVVTAQDRRAGLFTAEELPRGMCRIPYDWRGDPELAHAMADEDAKHSTWITAIDDPYLPMYYATLNLWDYLGRGLDKRWMSVSVAQTGDMEDFLRCGRALGAAAVPAGGRAPGPPSAPRDCADLRGGDRHAALGDDALRFVQGFLLEVRFVILFPLTNPSPAGLAPVAVPYRRPRHSPASTASS